MERSFELKLGQHFKIVHKLCFSLRILLNLGSKELFLVIHILFIRYIFINRELNQVLFRTSRNYVVELSYI